MGLIGNPIRVGFGGWSPDVDGDGGQFLVAWQRSEPAGSTVSDTVCRRLVVGPGGPLIVDGPETVVASLPNESEYAPQVAWLGAKYMIAYRGGCANSDDCVTVTAHSAIDGAPCGEHHEVDSANIVPFLQMNFGHDGFLGPRRLRPRGNADGQRTGRTR